MLIGWVVDTSNPNYRTALGSEQYEMIKQQNMDYTGSYIDRKDQPIANKDIYVTAVIFEDVIGGNIVWTESHKTTTNELGEFEIEIGNPEVILSANFSNLREPREYERYKAELVIIDDEIETVIYDGYFEADENNIFVSKTDITGMELWDKSHRGEISIFSVIDYVYENEDGEQIQEQIIESVWKETTRFYVDEAGQFEIIMGQGRLLHASREYFGLTSDSYSLEIIKPLDYTNPMLVFSLLGFFGFLFAFLLKRDDKTSGYGLELPNKVIKKEDE
jgi:hypothetical protein